MLKQEAIRQLDSLQCILQQITVEDYSRKLSVLKGSSIGMHMRHIIEFYECLLNSSVSDIVCYDTRKRNMLLEGNIKYTQDFILVIKDALSRLTSNARKVVIANYQSQQVSMESSIYRELAYTIEHTVHHLAIISIVVPQYFSYISLPTDLGYASSTLAYLNAQQEI